MAYKGKIVQAQFNNKEKYVVTDERKCEFYPTCMSSQIFSKTHGHLPECDGILLTLLYIDVDDDNELFSKHINQCSKYYKVI